MEIKNGIIYLEDRVGSTPHIDSITYTDKEGNRVNIPYSLLFGLCELVEYDAKRRGIDLTKYKGK